jgi:hypothetical protein
MRIEYHVKYPSKVKLISEPKILLLLRSRTDYSSTEVLIIHQPRTLARVILFMEWHK